MKLSTFILPALLVAGIYIPKTSYADCGETASVHVVIPTPEDIYFGYNSASLDINSIFQIRDNARWFRLNGSKVLIEGHCDERGSIKYNHSLGLSRAEVTRQYMVEIGFEPKDISTEGVGEDKPFSIGHTQADWASNRRSHFVAQ